MARIIYSALVNEINGTIRGTTFQRNRYGFSIKGKPNMIIPRSVVQTSRKLAIQSLSKQWNEAGATIRAYFNTYNTTYPTASRLNPSVNISGYNLYMSYGLYRWLSAPRKIPTGTGVLALTYTFQSMTVNSDGSTDMYLELFFNSNSSAWLINVFMTAIVSPSRTVSRMTPVYVAIKTTATVVSGDDRTFVVDLLSAYQNLFPVVPNVGDIVAVKVVLISTGRPQIIVIPTQLITVSTV
jgi:hypothetical protein